MKKWDLVTTYLTKFLQNEVEKTGLKHVVVGLSGGLDSAVVALLCKRAFGERVLCVLMPSQYSSNSSIDDALELCKVHKIKNETVSVAPMIEAYVKEEMNNLRIGNFSARMRMSVLYDLSQRENALVIGTSNKSELMLGYGTLHGDLASAINPIGDIYKSDLYEYASYLGVTEAILTKAPSADLYEGQSDESDLGFTYKEIDTVLKRYVDERATKEELFSEGFDTTLVNMCIKRIYQNQFKRKPTIIAKLTSRSINHDFLYPRDINL